MPLFTKEETLILAEGLLDNSVKNLRIRIYQQYLYAGNKQARKDIRAKTPQRPLFLDLLDRTDKKYTHISDDKPYEVDSF